MESSHGACLKDTVEKLLTIEKLRNCFECGICTSSCPMTELLGLDYNPRKLIERIWQEPESLLDSKELWLCAWCYSCNKHCPQGLQIPKILLAMRKNAKESNHVQSFWSAIETIVEHVPLPLITISVCFHPERAGLEKKEIIEKVEQAYRGHLEKQKEKRAQQAFEEKVAVIGSGPAGLTVAYQLSIRGYGVTVFEAAAELGGMLKKCIPCYRLDREVIDKEIHILKELGIEMKPNMRVGKDIPFSELKREGYKAIFIGVGAQKSQKLKIEGGELSGVEQAVSFLWKANSSEIVLTGRKVIVIGGGNVAVDAARTSLRLGASEITMLYRRSRDEMTAIPWEIHEAEKEGVKIEFLASPKRIVGNGNQVSAVECVRMQLGEPDETGRRRPIAIEDSEFTKQADMVILAIGETPDLEFLPGDYERNEDGTIWIDPVTMETNIKGVFAGGDVVTGPATVIEAIRAGRCAAEFINSYLEASRSK